MNFVQNWLKAPGIPFPVTLFLYIVIAFGVLLGLPALLGNGMMETHTVGWGGRELGVGIGAILAAVMRNAVAYFIIFVIGIFRELSDVLEALAETPANMTSAVMISFFIVCGIVSAYYSYRAMKA